ncbi:MAG: A24 family peptidase [Alphaproteobacteria bacterium]|nr:A24 family peptidase [Alphaproteobacteria bacterium]
MPDHSAIELLAPLILAPVFGSFIGVLILRLPQDRPLAWARSACPHCGHRLGPRDLVPLLSWILSRGRCRYCAASLGAFYPAIELAALGVALWAASVLTGWLLWASCALGWTLLALAVIDQRHMFLPNALTLPLIPAGLMAAYFVDPALLLDHAVGAVAGFAVFALIGWIYESLRGRKGLGLGDAKLLAAAGAWVSWQGLPTVVLWGSLILLLVALVRGLLTRSLSPADKLPFGPSLCFGIWLVWLYGPAILI